MSRFWLSIVILLVLVSGALAFGLGTPRLGRLGYMAAKKPAVAVPSCPSPTAPNGVFDLSLCSNSSYIVIFML